MGSCIPLEESTVDMSTYGAAVLIWSAIKAGLGNPLLSEERLDASVTRILELEPAITHV
jgi:hypothetical protein